MHELSVCRGLMGQIEKLAGEHGARRVTRIVVRIGPLSGVVGQLLREAFTIARTGTVASNAELEIEQVPVRVRCQFCGTASAAAANRLVCGNCGDWRTRLVGGDELTLSRLEFDSVSDRQPS